MKKFFVMLLISGIFFSCAKKVEKKDVMSKAFSLYEKGEYSDARKYLKEAIYKAEGLTTNELLKLRYLLANTYYLDENYVDAIVEFEEFLALFPTAPQVPEVLYKLADSYMKVAPGAERDLTYVEKAIEKAEELIETYPDTVYARKAKEILKKAKLIEAQHLLEIANLYEHLGKFYGAAVYYQKAYDEYSDYLEKGKVEYKIAENLLKTKQQYKKDISIYKEKIKKLEKKITLEKNLKKKNVLINRKKLLEQQLDNLEKRVEKSVERGKAILRYIIDTYPESEYAQMAKKLLKEE
jgi:outer membrane protein assembly factor BamD